MEEEPSVNISAILNQFMVGYDKRVRPNYGGVPVTVGVSLYILSIGDLSEKYMDFTFDMYFRQFWKDPRLSFDERPNLKKLVVGAEYIKGSFKNLFHQFSRIAEFLSFWCVELNSRIIILICGTGLEQYNWWVLLASNIKQKKYSNIKGKAVNQQKIDKSFKILPNFWNWFLFLP